MSNTAYGVCTVHPDLHHFSDECVGFRETPRKENE